MAMVFFVRVRRRVQTIRVLTHLPFFYDHVVWVVEVHDLGFEGFLWHDVSEQVIITARNFSNSENETESRFSTYDSLMTPYEFHLL